MNWFTPAGGLAIVDIDNENLVELAPHLSGHWCEVYDAEDLRFPAVFVGAEHHPDDSAVSIRVTRHIYGPFGPVELSDFAEALLGDRPSGRPWATRFYMPVGKLPPGYGGDS